MDEESIWCPEVLSDDAHETISKLSKLSALGAFYLAGGTALALRYGHRKSEDLDFFSSETVDEDLLLAALQPIGEIAVVSKAPQTLHLHVSFTKVSFPGYPYPVLFPFMAYRGLKVADPRDIAAMKLTAIASRGTRRDFMDLYVLSQEYGLDEVIRIVARKFSHTAFSDVHLMKALTYFADAEKEPMPQMLQPITWDEVKGFFLAAVPRLRG